MNQNLDRPIQPERWVLDAKVMLPVDKLKRLGMLHRTGHIEYTTSPNPANYAGFRGHFHNGIEVRLVKGTRIAMHMLWEIGFRPRPVRIPKTGVAEYGAP